MNVQLVKPGNLLLFPHREKQGTPSSHLDPFTNERRKSDLQKTSTLHETLLAGTCWARPGAFTNIQECSKELLCYWVKAAYQGNSKKKPQEIDDNFNLCKYNDHGTVD